MHQVADSRPRYALYFCPEPSSLLYRLGSRWLGRDLAANDDLMPSLPDSIAPAEWSTVTASARRYAFHATLKPPFLLAPGATLQELQSDLRTFAAARGIVQMPQLKVGTLGRFLALIPSQECAALHELADDCVREFDPFRAPATEVELAARKAGKLSPREDENLAAWGYPYVFDTWKFHMTLTCSLAADRLEIFADHLKTEFAEACSEPLCVRSICLLEEPAPGQPFRLVERVSLAC